MAGWEVHIRQIGNIPCAHNNTTRVRVVLYCLYSIGYLVYISSIIVGPRTPLVSVDMSEVSVFVSPFVPDAYPVILQVFGIGITSQKPKELVYD